MKKQVILLFALLSASLIVNAQNEYRLAKTTGQLKLNLKGAIIEGYDGKEIIFSSKHTAPVEIDERAKGLLPISSAGYIDNTGLGIHVKESGPDVNVNQVVKNSSDILIIKVPYGIKVSFTNNSTQVYDDIIIRNLKSEIEVATNSNKIKLEYNTGPMTINTINGSVEAIFNNDIKGPISIISINDYVDVTLALNTKANIELASNYGKLYAAKEFEIVIDTSAVKKNNGAPSISITGTNGTSNHKMGDMQINSTITKPVSGLTGQGAVTIGYAYYLGEKIKGKINGGGIDLILRSNNSNVYLRQK